MNVKLWNDNFLPFEQEFEDSVIKIPAGRFIVMDKEKAIKFRGTYYPIELDAGNRQLPKSYKKLRIEEIEKGEEIKINKNKCQACGFNALSEKDLDEHINENHIHEMLDKKEREKRLSGKVEK